MQTSVGPRQPRARHGGHSQEGGGAVGGAQARGGGRGGETLLDLTRGWGLDPGGDAHCIRQVSGDKSTSHLYFYILAKMGAADPVWSRPPRPTSRHLRGRASPLQPPAHPVWPGPAWVARSRGDQGTYIILHLLLAELSFDKLA